MRIAVNVRFLIKNKLEGIGWYTHEVLKRIVLAHPEDQFLFYFDRPYHPDFIFANNITPVVIRPAARHPFLWYFWFEHGVKQQLKKDKPDVFFSPDGYLSLQTDIPSTVVIHDLAYLHYPSHVSFFVRKYYAFFTPRFLQTAQHIFAVSNATKQDIIKQFNIPSDLISIAYNGCRSAFKALPAEDILAIRKSVTNGCPYFLFVGALHPRKNIAGLIKAFTQFKQKTKSEIHLVIVGRKAWNTKDIDLAFEQSTYQSDIHFKPYLDTQQLALISGAAEAAIAPSLLEGFGVPVLEALKSDVPVLVSNTFSLPEIGGPAAFTFDPTNIDSMSEAMERYISRIGDRAEIVRQGRDHAKQFNWDETSKHIYKVIKMTMKRI